MKVVITDSEAKTQAQIPSLSLSSTTSCSISPHLALFFRLRAITGLTPQALLT